MGISWQGHAAGCGESFRARVVQLRACQIPCVIYTANDEDLAVLQQGRGVRFPRRVHGAG